MNTATGVFSGWCTEPANRTESVVSTCADRDSSNLRAKRAV